MGTSDGIPNYDIVGNGVSGEETYFGAVVDKTNSRLTIVPYDEAVNGELVDPSVIETVSLANTTANYYLYDPARSGNAKFQLGSLGDIYIDNILAADGAELEANADENAAKQINVVINGQTYKAPVYGACDFVYIRMYERQGRCS